MSLKEDLETIKQTGLQEVTAASDSKALNEIKVKLLGKKGPITKALRGISQLSVAERPIVGSFANKVRDELTDAINEKQTQLEREILNKQLASETIDVTLPGNNIPMGHPHVIQQVIDEIEDIFIGMGYQVLNGPEVEEEHYNFEMMNLPKNHPARDMQDTFYITKEILMRTHTSPMQARALQQHDFNKGPLKMISPGVVFRRDTDDPTHSHQFHQVEGIVIDKHITMADLKGTLEVMSHKLFGDKFKVRVRPSYFPFTEPSVEADVTCMNCEGKGCEVCKGSGWIEVLGAGMVHPNVLKMAGVDSQEYGGFAFGVGPDRFAMLKYGVNDIRDFYLNDLRFLTQFD
ncbi:phenylalanine--tRNA ligase subunit alpha [Fructilactobacillus lindneri]|uniref:Phenylalanine--tRNA ligase alpha subunit n=4 Tax=Fructilactobacillus lindneri TaxID=53444 RepID=A0A0R2JXZ7_9LACO|nr:phenylalanine--tRNA ligase subunit alpha [Fructilactobacillus lindneri]ANZ58249.1 phenylalanine--tRNA ligase subunit alpha [Fructilactobacillus lindneri]ANZ59571.1 phenylalanine--tRNA ligase subunit alpha [Fructilactobacillus lindneri]KRN79076.1 phenylalanyl-tRNA synthetase subunit alpha [Fructilactobacillus lindneri DSM 20690 = JCM 11027]POG98644.1 phenylalanine--tRNA ligase subunit alpha [Fructilactobacillus lindneri]POH04032.1 phenylalanine--tRNA ligase subunit alpha [Fructilactobacillus